MVINLVLKIAFSVDDYNPSIGFGLFFDSPPVKYLRDLNQEFGCKFTMFTVPFYMEQESAHFDKQFPWIKKVRNIEYFEIAQHGLTHKAIRPEYEGQEMLGRSLPEIQQRIIDGKKLFTKNGINVVGYKSPGWAQPPQIYQMLENLGYQYIGDHFIGSNPIKQGNLLRVPYTWSIDRLSPEIAAMYKEGYLILHSHIHPNDGRTLNAWNEQNYQLVRAFLKDIKQRGVEVEFIFMRDIQ